MINSDQPKTIILLRMEDVAKVLNISPSQAYRLAKKGVLPSIRFGSAVRVKPNDLEKFIQDHRTPGN